MISVEKAIQLVELHTQTNDYERIPIARSLGRVLASDVFSKVDIPGFNQSAMDGYAVNALGDIAEGDSFQVTAVVQAGDTNAYEVQPGECTRIFTGSPMPKGANTVVIQEIVTVKDSSIVVNKLVVNGANVREQGEQMGSGDTGLQKGTLVTPAGVGFLAMMGYDAVPVIKTPKIAIVVTGDELVQPGTALKYGQIYESNSVTLKSALMQYGYNEVEVFFVKDSYEGTYNVLQQVLLEFDVVLASGGISVGDFDFVGKALRNLEVEEIFYKVKQKPGKPLFFAKKKDTLIFALPGNPASALTNLYYYVLPALNKMTGKGFIGLEPKRLPLLGGYNKKGDRAQFLKGFVTVDGVEILEGQSSAMMHTYAVTNALIHISAEIAKVEDKEEVTVYQL